MIGWPEEIRHIGRLEAQDFYRHHYAPNNAILVIAGDVTVDEVRNAAQAAYAKVPARELVPRAAFAEPARMAETRIQASSPDARVPLFLREYRVPSPTPKPAPGQAEALETLAQLMGGDYSSTLYRKLVVEKKLATNAGANYDGYHRDAGEFSVYAYPRPGVSMDVLERALDQVVASYSRTAPNVKELARAKTQLVASATYRRDSQFAMASAYGQALAIGLTAFDVRAWPDRIQAVKPDAVVKAARRPPDPARGGERHADAGGAMRKTGSRPSRQPVIPGEDRALACDPRERGPQVLTPAVVCPHHPGSPPPRAASRRSAGDDKLGTWRIVPRLSCDPSRPPARHGPGLRRQTPRRRERRRGLVRRGPHPADDRAGRVVPCGLGLRSAGQGGARRLRRRDARRGRRQHERRAFHDALADHAIQLSVQSSRDWTVVSLIT